MSDGREVSSGLDYYRVQSDKRWWRRKWQAEWDGCRWAQRGYTRSGIRAMVRVRRSHPAVDTLYIRCRIMIRRCVSADRRWYRRRYDWRGTPQTAPDTRNWWDIPAQEQHS